MFFRILGTRILTLFRWMRPVVVGLTLAGCASVVVIPPLEGLPPDAPEQRIKITAQKYRFEPETIKVPINTHVIIDIESLDVMHGFKLERYGIDKEIPVKGEGTVAVEFYTREIGTYKFKCSHICGIMHPWMNGKLVVE
ncbi:MAG: cupredoxin domain-containing protein [Candidatus Marinimicrobia bacterium]|nr:cupredoxin domain-containing protein [Candidatus Neomarinimicrobiota bacterium]